MFGHSLHEPSVPQGLVSLPFRRGEKGEMQECKHDNFTVRATLRAGEWTTILFCNNPKCGKCVSGHGKVRVDELHKNLVDNKDVFDEIIDDLPNDRKFDSRGHQ